jgi:hypothetical protein
MAPSNSAIASQREICQRRGTRPRGGTASSDSRRSVPILFPEGAAPRFGEGCASGSGRCSVNSYGIEAMLHPAGKRGKAAQWTRKFMKTYAMAEPATRAITGQRKDVRLRRRSASMCWCRSFGGQRKFSAALRSDAPRPPRARSNSNSRDGPKARNRIRSSGYRRSAATPHANSREPRIKHWRTRELGGLSAPRYFLRRACFAAAMQSFSLAMASSTVRVLRPQSGSTQTRSLGRRVSACSMRP